MRLFMFWAFLACAAPLSAFWPPAEWTVLCFMDAEGTLEESTLDNVVQMMKVGSGPHVRLVTLVDRPGLVTKEHIPDWKGARLFHVERDHLAQLEDWGPTNMGAPATLERFVRAAVQRFPARRYLLVLGDHGYGWPGMCADEDGRDQLTLPELSGVLAKCQDVLQGRLEIIGMDACLMSTAEAAAELAPHAKLLIASEEAAPTDGWRYDQLVEELERRPDAKLEELSRAVVDSYRKQFEEGEDQHLRAALSITLSVISLARMAPLEKALDELAGEALAALDQGAFEALSRARARCAAFGGEERTDAGRELFDLCDIAEQLAEVRPAMKPAVERLDRAVRAAVIHNLSGRARADARGLAVFWPESEPRLEEDDARYADLALARRTRWAEFARRYAAVNDGRTDRVDLTGVALSAAQVGKKPVTLTAKLEEGEPEAAWLGLWTGPVAPLPPAPPEPGSALAAGLAALSDGLFGRPPTRHTSGTPPVLLASRPYELSTTTTSSDTFDGRWLMVTEGRGGFPADLADFDALDGPEGDVLLNLSAQHCRAAGSRWDDVSLHFYFSEKDGEQRGELAYVTSRRPGAPDVVRLMPGDRLRPIHWSIEHNGSIKRHEAPAAFEIKLREPRNLGLRMIRLKPGRYGVGVVTRDAADRWAAWPVPLTVR